MVGVGADEQVVGGVRVEGSLDGLGESGEGGGGDGLVAGLKRGKAGVAEVGRELSAEEGVVVRGDEMEEVAGVPSDHGVSFLRMARLGK